MPPPRSQPGDREPAETDTTRSRRTLRGAASEFRAAWALDDDHATATPELLPVRLARACVQVLPIAAAGLSLFDDAFRVPLGASDEMATEAERLQFTQGEGPCLDAARDGRMLVVGAEDMARRWPTFADELFRRTPYRAIISVPLPLTDGLTGAMDAYILDPTDLEAVGIADIAVVTEEIVHALLVAQAITGSTASWTDELDPAWMHGPGAQTRRAVWLAIGMTMTRYDLSAPDSLSRLRAYAYAHETDVDEVATGLIDGRIDLNRLQL
jgi:GAF domain-containing protein